MRTRPTVTVTLSAVLLAVAVAAAQQAASLAAGREAAPARREAERARVRVGVVLKALDNPFFVAMYQGLRAEAARRDVRLTVRSVGSIVDTVGQAAQARAMVADRDDCYVVNPIAPTNLIAALRPARRPIVNVDSPIDRGAARRAGVPITTFIGTDDVRAGRSAGVRMAARLRGRGDVALIDGTAGSVNSRRRLAGFEAGIRGSGVRVVARVVADYDRTKAEIVAERILRAHPRIAGFFAANDLMALGIADAVRPAASSAPVTVIGVDGIPDALDAVRSGSLAATISQYPYVMGRMAIEACVAAARGGRLPARVFPPIAVVSRGNVTRAIAAFPAPLQRYPDPLSRLLRGRK
jgi:ABC-type sugar transport system substrate-binding protein